MKAPRVVHLVYDLIRGGTEGQCAQVAMALAGSGAEHRVAVFHWRGYYLEPVEAACGAVHEVRIRRLARWQTVREVGRLARWLRETEADILHTWDADAAIFGQFAAARAGVRLVTSRRDLGQIYPPWKLRLMRRADRQAVRVVANAAAIQEHFVSQGLSAEKVVVLPNVLDIGVFDAAAQKPFSMEGRLPPGRRLVVVNRLDPEKNTSLLIRALPLLREKIADAVLVVAGDGREMGVLREQARALSVADAVCFLGDVLDVPALLKQCEIGALVPSRNEGLSNTILEYMAAGLPVLASDCGGNRELVHHGETGFVVGMDAAPEEVAARWIALLQDSSQSAQMGKRGRERVELEFSLQEVIPRFEAFYRSI